jgi:hypothetical protein
MKVPAEQHLEYLFQQAIDDSNERPNFLSALMDAKIYVVGHSGGKEQTSDIVHHQLATDSPLFIKSWDDEQFDHIIPFFTSLEKMCLAIDPQESFVCLPTSIFMQMTLGSKLLLNPESNAIKVFYPTEVQALLDGNFHSAYVDEEEEVEVLLMQPLPYPEQMVAKLSVFLASQTVVKAAYLAEMVYAHAEDEAVLVIGLLLDITLSIDDMRVLNQQLGQVIFENLKNDHRAIDLIHLYLDDVVDGLEDYLLTETEPFYVRPNADYPQIFATLLC